MNTIANTHATKTTFTTKLHTNGMRQTENVLSKMKGRVHLKTALSLGDWCEQCGCVGAWAKHGVCRQWKVSKIKSDSLKNWSSKGKIHKDACLSRKENHGLKVAYYSFDGAQVHNFWLCEKGSRLLFPSLFTVCLSLLPFYVKFE